MFGLSKIENGVGGIALTEHAEPDAGPGEIRLKVAAAGICGTDMQIYHWPRAWPGAWPCRVFWAMKSAA